MTITVLGSINTDIVAKTKNYPKRGETIFGQTIKYLAGGKGANQATAVSRLGKKVQLIGAIGDDLYGENLLTSLKDNNINIEFVKKSKKMTTGTSIVVIDDRGENTILVLKGANDDLLVPDIESAFNDMEESNILLVQMEVPHESVIRAMQLAKERGMYVILDPAPAEGIVIEALEYADVVTPNQQETKTLLGIELTDMQSAITAGKRLEQMGVFNSIIKMGGQGSLVYQSGKYEWIDSIKVNAVDTLGAGDSFAGALACGLSDGLDLVSAAKLATVVAGLKVTKLGAQSIPDLQEVEKYCKENHLHDLFSIKK